MNNRKLPFIKRDLLHYLGPKYSVRTIGLVDVVYRDLGDYDIEIGHVRSGLLILIWDKQRHCTDRRYCGLKDFPTIRNILEDIVLRYGPEDNT